MNIHDRDRLLVLTRRIQRLEGMIRACSAEAMKILISAVPVPDGTGALPNLLGTFTDPKTLFDRPIIDQAGMAIVWRGCRCVLGYTRLFDLLEWLIKNPNRWIPYDRLRREVWQDDLLCDSAIKVAVTRLKAKMACSSMADLAQMIRTSGYRCGYFPAGDES